MNYLKIFSALALLFSFPIFSEVDHYVEGNCGCTIYCDETTGYCDEPVGPCECDWDCYEISDNNWDCYTDCYCYDDLPAAQTARQSAVLVYSTFNTSQNSALQTGVLGTTEGTYADKELVFVSDGENPRTNEVEIKSPWCK